MGQGSTNGNGSLDQWRTKGVRIPRSRVMGQMNDGSRGSQNVTHYQHCIQATKIYGDQTLFTDLIL